MNNIKEIENMNNIKEIEKSYFNWLRNKLKFILDEPMYDRNSGWNFKLILPEK